MREQLLTSRKNPLLQQLRKLLASRSLRYETGLFAADGSKLLQEAVQWQAPLEYVVLEEGVDASVPQTVPVYRVPKDVMESISPMQAPQGAIFVCKMPPRPQAAVVPGCLILDGIQDPGNLGTILRTADALEIPVILSDGCADPYNAKTVRATMGAVFRTPPQSLPRQEILAQCRQKQISLAVTRLSPLAQDIRKAPLERLALVIGSEGHGVCEDYLQAAEQQLIIPMNPRCESLNAATAATIVMWQMKNREEF